jgi:nitric oxide reductase subunit C
MAITVKHAIFGSMCAAFVAFSAHVYTDGTRLSGQPAFDERIGNGLALFQEKNCVACHQFYGLGGYMGPDLTNVVSAADKGAEYARGFLETGTMRMPDFGLSTREIDDLVRFLEYVDATGAYPPAKSEISWYGTVDYGPEPARQ